VFLNALRKSSVRICSRFSSGEALFLYRRRQMLGLGQPESALDFQDKSIENLRVSAGMFGHTLASIAMQEPSNLRVFFDRRRDLSRVLDSAGRAAGSSLSHQDLNPFKVEVRVGEADNPLAKAGARIAGVLAGDCVKFFSDRGGVVWSSLEPQLHFATSEGRNTRRVASFDSSLSGSGAPPSFPGHPPRAGSPT
jgi:hypothetical protein